jgi:uncharacterized protein (DUF2249 family)
MVISANTKISAILKANPAAIEAIVSINSHFVKLRNPLLRKYLASRVTISDAARIGRCKPETFFEKLAPLGFTVNDLSNTLPMQTAETNPAMPAYIAQLPQDKLIVLDVREDIRTGKDPFLKIMDAVKRIEAGNALLIVNTFEPTPLISILLKKGYGYYMEVKGDDLVHTYFWLQGAHITAAADDKNTTDSFDGAVAAFGERIRKVDVRHMEMPQPMVTILNELETLPQNEALYVAHRRVPQFLIPQLQERGFTMAIKETGPAEVCLLIYRSP